MIRLHDKQVMNAGEEVKPMKIWNHGEKKGKRAVSARASAAVGVLAMSALLFMLTNFYGKYACILSGVASSVLFVALFCEMRGQREKTGALMLFYRFALTLGMGICVVICATWVFDRVLGALAEGETTVAVNVLECLLVLCIMPVPFVVRWICPAADGQELCVAASMHKLMKALFLPFFAVIVAVGYAGLVLSVMDGRLRITVALYAATSGMAMYALLSLCLLWDNSRLATAFVRRGWMLLIPILVMYLIGAKARFDRHGLTMNFYASMIIVGHCMVMIAMMRLGMPVRRFFAMAAVSSLVFTCTPLGAYQLPMTNQQHRMQQLLEENGLYHDGALVVDGEIDETLMEKIYMINAYLREGKDDFDTPLMRSAVARDADEFAKLYGYVPSGAFRYSHFNNYSSQIDKTGFDVQGYSYAVPLVSHVSHPEGIVVEYKDKDGSTRKADLTQYALSLPQQYGEECFTCDLRFAVDDNTTLVFEYLDFKTYQGVVQWYQCRGYALLK